MNIVKLQEDLKDVPFKNLIFYVQSPNGQVPSYLALAEIKRRKDMESRAAASKNAPSSLSVAEELTAPRQNIGPQFDTPQTMMAAQQQAQPQTQMESGVASLPTGDMYQDQSFAGGGIVAFDGGGDVDVRPNINVRPLTNEQMQVLAAEYLGGADVGNDKMAAGVNYAGGIDKFGITKPELRDIYARYRTDDGAEYKGSYTPNARQLMLDRIKGNTSMGLTYSPDNVGIRAGYSFAKGGEVQHFANEGAVVFDRNMGPAAFDAELDDPSIDAYTRDLILRNRSKFGSEAPIQVAGEVNPALSSSQLGQSYWQNLKRKWALQKQKEARDVAIENEKQLKFWGGSGGYKSKESPVMTDKEVAAKAKADQATKDVTEPTITQDMINKLNAGAPAGGGIGGLRPNIATTKEKSIDEMIADRRKLLESQGIKTDHYSKMIEDLRKEKGEELDASKRMMQANILFSLAKSVGETPGGIMRGLTKGATEVGPAVMQGLKDQREIEKLGKKEERAMAALERAEKRGDTDAIEKARDKHQQIQAELEGRKISGEYSLAAARISSRPTTYEQVMKGLRENKAYYKLVDGKPVFDTEKAYNTYLGTRSGGALSETTLLKEYNDLVTQGRIDPALVSFQSYKASVGGNAGAATAGWGDLQVSK
jgi:hypothetical protein